MNRRSDGLALLGRVLLGALFVISGFEKIGGFSATAGFIASRGLPMPTVLAAVAVAIELLGGVALVVGFKTRWAALVLAAFLIVITPVFHSFWDAPAAEAMNQQINFMKNLSILGGMLVVAALGPGRYSIDRA